MHPTAVRRRSRQADGMDNVTKENAGQVRNEPAGPGDGKVTIYEVAAQAGVSITTV
jgi:hypothetical protein